MILSAEERYRTQIIELWNSAFGDKSEDINKYLETILKYVLVYEEDGVVCGMLSVLPVCFCGKTGGYIYAVTTHKDYRGKGICNKLMEYVKADKTYDFLVLKPQDEGLFEFYGKMGFEKVMCLSRKEVYGEKNTGYGYQLKALTANEYKLARGMYFGGKLIEWDSEMLSFAKDMYTGGFYEVEEGTKGIGYAFLYKDEDKVIIKELISKEAEKAVNFIALQLGYEKAEYMLSDKNGEDGFMIFPKNIEKGYFNIYLD